MLRQLGRLSFNLSDYYFFGHPIEKSHICLMTSQVEHRSGVRASPTGQKWTFLGHLRSDSNEIKFAVIGSFPSITAPIVMAIGCETTERPQGTSADINNLPFRGKWRSLSRLMAHPNEIKIALIDSFSAIYHCADFHCN